MTAHHLKRNPDKTELLFFLTKSCPMQELTISIDNATVASTPSAKNLGVVLDSQLSFKAHIASVTRSCRFTLYNIRRIRPFLTQESAHVMNIYAMLLFKIRKYIFIFLNARFFFASTSAIRINQKIYLSKDFSV